MASRPQPSRSNSHVPANPSSLRMTHAPGDGQATASSASASESTALLRPLAGARQDSFDSRYAHGTFSPRPESPLGSRAGEGESSSDSEGEQPRKNWKKKWASRIRSKKMSASNSLAAKHGVKHVGWRYLSYYLPVLAWVREYRWSYLQGDFIAALTIAGMYLPMVLSMAENLAHVPPINGLYSFVLHPFVYALLGSSPNLIVGPEAAGSLLVGSVVKGMDGEADEALVHARVCGVVTGIAGCVTLIAGLARLGFLDGVLSRPFLRGFISAIGVVIMVDQLVPELGLDRLQRETPGAGSGSSVDKLRFVFGHLDRVHGPTFALAGASFAIILVLRELKRRLQPRYPAVAYVPDRFVVVVLSAWLTYYFGWDRLGVPVLGRVEAASGRLFNFRWPLRASQMPYVRESMSTAFLIALLGFFESSVAAKGLGDSARFPSIRLSANRELVALGAANVLGGCFMALPAFGGYGRSKVGKATGAVSPMACVFLSIFSLVCILCVLPYFYYLPCPSDISFFVRIRAWPELALMLVIVLATIFYSLNLGVAIGIGLSLLQVVRHSTRPRIQILGRIPGTDRFENAEADPDLLEFIEGCLIVKIPEPLTFANTSELKTRLRRLELYGTSQAHPALPRLRREDSNRNVVFDIRGVTSLDGSGTQVLEEIVRGYRQRGVRVFFSRGPAKGDPLWKLMERSGIVRLAGGEAHFVADVHEALKMTDGEGEAEA